MAANKPVLTYFSIPASRGFAARVALRHAKIDFVDNRIDGKQFKSEYKPNPAKTPLGSLPVLVLPEGVFAQSTALARWAARKSDLYPNESLEQLIVDETMESMNEIFEKVGYDKDPAIRKTQRDAYTGSILPKYLNLLTERIKRSGGPFLLGTKLSIADLVIFSQLQTIYTGKLEHVPRDIIPGKYNLVHVLYTATEKHPLVQQDLQFSSKL